MNPDTEPTTGSPETPKMARLFTNLPKRTQYLFAALFVVSVLGAAYFIGSGNYYRVSPLPLSEPEYFVPGDSGEAVAGMFRILKGDELRDFRIGVLNAKLPECETVDPTSDTEDMREENDVVTYYHGNDSTEGVRLCNHVHAQGASAIQNIQFAQADREYSSLGVGSLQIGGSVYLVPLHLTNHYETDLPTLSLGPKGKLKDARAVTDLAFVQHPHGSTLLKITGISSAGQPFERYLVLEYSIHGSWLGSPVALSSEGQLEQHVSFDPKTDRSWPSDATYPRVSFTVPFLATIHGPSQGDIYSNYMVPPTQKMFHAAGCALEESFADVEFTSGTRYNRMSTSIKIHTGRDQLIHVTSARSGYAPEDWGKVLRTVPLETFRESVRAPKAHNSSALVRVEMLGGHSVKVVGPISNCAPTHGGSWYRINYYQYQTVWHSMIVTVTFALHAWQPEEIPPSFPQPDADAFVAKLLETLTVTP